MSEFLELLAVPEYQEGIQAGGIVGGVIGLVSFLLYSFVCRRRRYLIHAAVFGYFSLGFYLTGVFFLPAVGVTLLIYLGSMFVMIGLGVVCALFLVAAYWIRDAFTRS